MIADRQGSANLRKLVGDLLGGTVSVADFAKLFERGYNDADEGDINVEDQATFSALFDVVAWYSPFPDERVEVPHLVDEGAVLEATRKAAKELGIDSRE